MNFTFDKYQKSRLKSLWIVSTTKNVRPALPVTLIIKRALIFIVEPALL